MANQTAVTTTQAPSLLFFSKVSLGPGDSQLLFKLIHFWEARNNSKGGILLGFEMLMIDEERFIKDGGMWASFFVLGLIFAPVTQPVNNRPYCKHGSKRRFDIRLELAFISDGT
ncbi:hypothetical protein IGI04_039745 [Brassica rapa subsp. trilocularis]|uniref:Uncharacterized protein n=1 Tax=Brassica rapa subsp. trilocularis TaxID=1813537 RepID=A0ABQ7KPF5_BRACM|nr:hypothetical protein IGI04_039745 [Brassica rapa subsp. trilocularis]